MRRGLWTPELWTPGDGPAGVPLDLMDDVEALAALEAREWKRRSEGVRRSGDPMAAGSQWYRDLKAPFGADDFPTITLSTTSLMLLPGGTFSKTVPEDWFTGKRMSLEFWGRITTAATPGNLTIEVRYGTTDNAGTILATSAATALAATKANISWYLQVIVRCRDTNVVTGANGSLFAMGRFMYDGAAALFTTTAQNPLFIPATAPAATAVDLSAASGLNVQMKRSGSTVETVAVHDFAFEHLN